MIFDPDTRSISFASNEPDEDEVDPKQHYAELVEDVKSMMRKIMKAPNENFPDFLWEPVQNDFTEDGHEDIHQYIDMGLGRIEVENGTEIMESINRIKNRYKDYFDYIDALAVWQRYYDFVEETYGDFDYFAQMVENGETSFPFRRRPKLKNAKKNKHLLEIDVPISRINREDGLSDEQLKELGDNMPDQLEIYEDYFEYITYLAQYNEKEEKRLQRENRIRNYRRVSSVGSPEINAITEYLTGGEFTTSEYGLSKNRPLSDDLEAFHEYDGLNEDLKRDAMGLRKKVYMDTNYQIMMETGQTQDDIDVYSTLAANGYEVSCMMTNSNMDRKAVKLITRSIPGLEEEMSPKKAKKMKKKRAKNEKKLYDALSANEEVRKIMTKNRISFDAEDNMMSFTLKDIINNDGGL